MPITLKWAGKTYTIDDSRAFEVGVAVEDVITLSQVASIHEHQRVHRLAWGYQIMLGFVGVFTTPEAVHKVMARGMRTPGSDEHKLISHAISEMLAMMLAYAPDEVRNGGKKEPDETAKTEQSASSESATKSP